MTEQQIDAEIVARGYEPYRLNGPYWYWFPEAPEANTRLNADLSAEWFEALRPGPPYPTREAAFADLRQALRVSG